MDSKQKIHKIKINLQVLKSLDNKYFSIPNFTLLSDYAEQTEKLIGDEKISNKINVLIKSVEEAVQNKKNEKFMLACKQLIDLIEGYIILFAEEDNKSDEKK